MCVCAVAYENTMAQKVRNLVFNGKLPDLCNHFKKYIELIKNTFKKYKIEFFETEWYERIFERRRQLKMM